MPPTVSVVIPAYNYGRFLGAAIESVLGQSHAASEIIIVDGGSTDDTPEVAKGFSEVTYIRQENLGVCAARNRGVEASGGEYIAFLDADDTWEPSKLKKQLAMFTTDT